MFGRQEHRYRHEDIDLVVDVEGGRRVSPSWYLRAMVELVWSLGGRVGRVHQTEELYVFGR